MTSSKSQEIVEEYKSSLADLKINSKPLINMLTMLAQDNIEHAPAIVACVESHLQKVPNDIKLPVLYLIDSIVKNVNGPYLKLFTQNIANTFCSVFEKMDETRRASMWKLRQTWNDVFPSQKLLQLDLRVQSIDPAWPVTASSSIHVNPKFLSIPHRQTSSSSIVPPLTKPLPSEPVSTNLIKEQLQKAQQELLELQQQKVKIELMQAKAKLDQQQKMLDRQLASLKNEMTFARTTAPTESGVKSVAFVTPNQIQPSFVKQQAPVQPTPSIKPLMEKKSDEMLRLAEVQNLTFPTTATTNNPRTANAINNERNIVPSNNDPQFAVGSKSRDNSRNHLHIPPLLPLNTNTVLSEQLKQQLMLKGASVIASTKVNKPLTIDSGVNAFDLINSTKAVGDNNCANLNIMITNSSSSNNKALDDGLKISSRRRNPCSSIVAATPDFDGVVSKLSNDEIRQCAADDFTFDESNNSRSSKSSFKDASSMGSSQSCSATGDRNNSSLSSKLSRRRSDKSKSKDSKVDSRGDIGRKSLRKSDEESWKVSTSCSPQSFASRSVVKSRRKNAKSRKRSPSSPVEHSRARHSKSSTICGLLEEEQSGSLIVSPPHPPTLMKADRHKHRGAHKKRNKERSLDPDDPSIATSGNHDNSQPTHESPESISKDEDLRSTLALGPTTADANDCKMEDEDLRIVPAANNKRSSANPIEGAPTKRSKAEKFQGLFGSKDVDLRTLVNPKAGRPPTPPPPVISGGEDGKDGWAKLKTPASKSEGNNKSRGSNDDNESKRERDRNRDRLGRPRMFNKLPIDPKDSTKCGRRSRDHERHHERPTVSGRSIEIVMKQAAEQLNQGTITKSQYNTLIQEVLHMSEDDKSRCPPSMQQQQQQQQRKDNSDMSKMVWADQVQNYMSSTGEADASSRASMRWPYPWQHHQSPWIHPPPFVQNHPFNVDYRASMGPWQQQPRAFTPFRQDPFFHGAAASLTSLEGQNNRIRAGIMRPSLSIGANVSSMAAHQALGMNMGHADLAACLTRGVAAAGDSATPSAAIGTTCTVNLNPGKNTSPKSSTKCELTEEPELAVINSSMYSNRCLPLPDSKLLSEGVKSTTESVEIDGSTRDLRYYGETAIVLLSFDDPREISFQSGVREITIDETETVVCAFGEPYKDFIYQGEVHKIKLGGPKRELHVDEQWYQCFFGGPEITVELDGKKVRVKIDGPPPQANIGTVKRTDLVCGKTYMIIDAQVKVPVFLDATPQIFEIDGHLHTLEFADCFKTVLLNGRSFKVDFGGGLSLPIISRGKKHLIRFLKLPPGCIPGHTTVAGMKKDQSSFATNNKSDSSSTLSSSIAALNSMSLKVPQPAVDRSNINMAPATTTQKTSEIHTSQSPLPLDMSNLFTKLVEAGIVPNIFEAKKQDDEEKVKEPEIIPVSFDKPMTLREKQPAIAATLYSGMQCSSCGARFAPELAAKYSHHLDWHFRQNRRERDFAKKVHSRPWYYEISDWIQFEEIEDLEDRALSWFETEKQSSEVAGVTGEDLTVELVQPSVPAGKDEDSRCHVCMDNFEQFYNEETEEWHCRPAVVFEDKNFHPLCLEDYKEKCLKNESNNTAEGTSVTDLQQESQSDTNTLESEAVEQIEPDNNCTVGEKLQSPVEQIEEDPASDSAIAKNTDDDVIPIEKKIEEAIVIDENDDEPFNLPLDIKIKQEPIEIEPESEETIVSEPAIVDTTFVAVKSSIDGNVELDSTPATILAAPNRIKINITKPLPTTIKESDEIIESAEVQEEESEVNVVMTPKSVKPALQARKLSNLPMVNKGHELSGLCSIM